MRGAAYFAAAIAVLSMGGVSASAVEKADVEVDYKQHVDPKKAKNPIAVDDKGVPVCTRKYPSIAKIGYEHFETCSETCEKAYYFKDGRLGWHEYRKCHSCCADRRQTWEFERREVMCPSTGGKMCNGKGKCDFATSKCKCFAKWGGHACEEERKFASCYAVGDPHYRSFDGLTYNIYTPRGEYLVYNRADNPDNEAVVSDVVKYHNPVVSVNRGIAVRRRDEIVKIEWPSRKILLNCRDITKTVAAKGSGVHVTKSGMRLNIRGNQAMVTTPSGLEVRVQTYGWGQNLYVRIFAPQDGQSKGICGSFSGTRGADLGFPAHRERRQPVVKVLNSNLVPATQSLLNCRPLGYKAQFEEVFLGSEPEIQQDTESLSLLAAESSASREPVTLRKEILKLITPEQKTDLEDLYQTCKGGLRLDAEEACLGLFAKGAGDEFVDCVTDQCELGGGAEGKQFVSAAIDAAGEEKLVTIGERKAQIFMDNKEIEEENTGAAEEGRPETADDEE